MVLDPAGVPAATDITPVDVLSVTPALPEGVITVMLTPATVAAAPLSMSLFVTTLPRGGVDAPFTVPKLSFTASMVSTAVFTVLVLLPGTGSETVPGGVTVAVLLSVMMALGAVTVMVTVMPPPFGSAVIVPLTVPALLVTAPQVVAPTGVLQLAETKAVPPGRVSLKVALLAAFGPRVVMTRL